MANTMNKTADPASNPLQAVCECGRDHRRTDSRECPIFKALDDLNRNMKEFLVMHELLEFGQNGPMADCLRSTIREKYNNMKVIFDNYQNTSIKNPGWHLGEEISRLRRYFEQISQSCAEEKEAPRLYNRGRGAVLPEIIGYEDPMWREAAQKTIDCYNECCCAVAAHASWGAKHHPNERTMLENVDNAFLQACEAIFHLPKGDNAEIQDLTKKSYEIWRETRRLLCDFGKPRKRFVGTTLSSQ